MISLREGGRIRIREDGDWEFPVGITLIKSFRLYDRLIETRLLVRHGDGGWAGYRYEWNDEQTDAVLPTGAKTKTIEGQTWSYPARGECLGCHTDAASFVLGLETAQMNREFTYPTKRRTANQLSTFERSILSMRMPRVDVERKLPIGKHTADPVGTTLVDEWIFSMAACP